MKASKKLLLSLLALLLITASTFARTENGEFDNVSKDKYPAIEANLMVGLQSDNEGLRISSAYYLGELKSKNAVHQLMKILREDESYPSRIVAALSLIKIDDPQGIYMVQRTSQFNTQEGVRKMSERFYLSYLLKKYIEENPGKGKDLAYIKF